MRRRKGQSVLEYTLLITAVILVIVYGVNTIIAKKAKAQVDGAGIMLDNAQAKWSASVAP